MKLLFCTTDGDNAFNGINSWLVRFLPSLRAHGHDARALLFTWSAPTHCTTLPLLEAAMVPTLVIDRGWNTEYSIRVCLNHVKSFKPDVFVPNHVLPALYAAGWARESGIPTIGIWHNDDEEYRAKNSAFVTGPDFFRLSGLAVISNGLRALASKCPHSVPIRCIPYGVPTPPSAATWDGHKPLRLVYHGRLVQTQKRIGETATALVRAAHKSGATADIFGSGPDANVVCDVLARDDAVGRVRLRGPLLHREVFSTLIGYHVAVLLSDYEGLGLSILEAMACGLVPICLRTASGLQDLIEHGKNGLFVDDRQEGFDAAIARLVASPADWTRLSAAARTTAAERFSETASLVAWENFFNELVDAAPHREPLRVPMRVALPPSLPALLMEDRRYPGLVRAIWRRLRFPKR